MFPRIFMYMQENGVPFNAETFNPLLNYYAQDNDHDQVY